MCDASQNNNKLGKSRVSHVQHFRNENTTKKKGKTLTGITQNKHQCLKQASTISWNRISLLSFATMNKRVGNHSKTTKEKHYKAEGESRRHVIYLFMVEALYKPRTL